MLLGGAYGQSTPLTPQVVSTDRNPEALDEGRLVEIEESLLPGHEPLVADPMWQMRYHANVPYLLGCIRQLQLENRGLRILSDGQERRIGSLHKSLDIVTKQRDGVEPLELSDDD